MPYLADEEEKQLESQQPQQVSGQSSVISGSNAPMQKGAKSSGSYTNLNTYLQANKPQAQQMGQQVAGGIEQKANQAQQDIDAFKQAGNQQVAAKTAQDITSQLQQPTQNAQQYQQFRQTGGYSGPTSLENVSGYQQAQKSGTEATQAVQNVGSEAGRTELVKQQYARPSYSAGQQKLDTMLVSRNPEAKTALQQTADKWKNLNDTLSGATQQVGQQVQQNVATAAKNKELAAQTENEFINKYRGDLQAKADEHNKTQGAKYQDLLAELGSDTGVSADTLANLGLMENQQLYNTDLRNYLSPEAIQATASDVATPEQRQYWNDLNNLLGRQDNSIGQGQELRGVKLDTEKLQKDLSGSKAEVEKVAATPIPTTIPAGPTYAEMISSNKTPEQFIHERYMSNPDYQNNIINHAIKLAKQQGMAFARMNIHQLNPIIEAVKAQEAKNANDQLVRFKRETNYDRRINPAKSTKTI